MIENCTSTKASTEFIQALVLLSLLLCLSIVNAAKANDGDEVSKVASKPSIWDYWDAEAVKQAGINAVGGGLNHLDTIKKAAGESWNNLNTDAVKEAASQSLTYANLDAIKQVASQGLKYANAETMKQLASQGWSYADFEALKKAAGKG